MINEQITFRQTLFEELEGIKRKNPSYSLRAFARKLELSPGHLSAFLSGKKILSQKMMDKILLKLDSEAAEKIKSRPSNPLMQWMNSNLDELEIENLNKDLVGLISQNTDKRIAKITIEFK